MTDGEGRLSGIVTERDLLHRMADELDPTAHRLADVMTPAPETVRLEHSLAHAAHRMTISDLRYLPLVDEDGRPERIVDSRDLIGYLSTLAQAVESEIFEAVAQSDQPGILPRAVEVALHERQVARIEPVGLRMLASLPVVEKAPRRIAPR